MIARRTTLPLAVAIACLIAVATTTPAQAVILTLNTFDSENDTTFAKENVSGSPTLTLNEAFHTGTVGGEVFIDADGTNHASTRVANWTDTSSGNAHWTLDLNTSRYSDLMLRFDNRSSGVGATGITISYAVNNTGVFTDVQTLALNRDPNFSAYSVDLSAIDAIENAPSVQIRGLWDTDGTNPNTRLDNLQLTGTKNTQLLTFFNFNDMAALNNGTTNVTKNYMQGTPTITMSENGGGLVDPNGQGGNAYIDLEGTNHAAGAAAGWTDGVDGPGPNIWTLDVDTTSFMDLELGFEYRITNVSPSQIGSSQLTLSYSVDGDPFTDITTLDLIRDSAYHEVLLDLADLDVLENSSNVQIRGIWSTDGQGSASARLDNLYLTGVDFVGGVVPEPSSLALLGSLVVGLLSVRRRK